LLGACGLQLFSFFNFLAKLLNLQPQLGLTNLTPDP